MTTFIFGNQGSLRDLDVLCSALNKSRIKNEIQLYKCVVFLVYMLVANGEIYHMNQSTMMFQIRSRIME